ncbi:MAG TPA: carbamate kinase [Streptosporangiaceae bacterium]|jgi:carbamate kinase|nr:carbamate kinase [Streptosporangiaceae bacterium]
MTVLIALGGNAMTAPDGSARPQDQHAAIGVAAESIADIVAAGNPVVLTHGNGPQVGNLLVKNEIAAAIVPPVPLDWCGAQTQGTIGVLLLNALDAALARRGASTRTAVVVSRTLVDPADHGFADPAKPIGRYVSAAEAADLTAHGQTWRDFGSRGWRRVVASPEPLACLDAAAAAALLGAGFVVVCAGGGGVPTIRDERGELRGMEAVIDKDLTAAVLARQLNADTLIIATDVEAVIDGWGTAAARPIGEIPVARMRALAGDGHFPAGSMGPKVEAACRFAEGGGRAIITSLHHISDALAGKAGTAVIP